MSLRSWVELVTTIIMSDQNVSAETKEKLGGIAHELLEEIESGLTKRALDLPSASAGCKCFVSIESYNNCPVHGTANH